MNFTIYDASGTILRSGAAPEDMVHAQAQGGEFILTDVAASDALQYVADGVLLDYTAEELQTKAAMPHGWVWKMPERIAVDMRQLVAVQAQAIKRTFADVNSVVEDAVGNLSKEYIDAEADARAFAAAGYAGVAPESVSSYAQNNSTMAVQTDEWAAQNIIARANAFEWAQGQMRTKRFEHQGLMRTATTLADVDAAVTSWNGFIAQLRTQLGL